MTDPNLIPDDQRTLIVLAIVKHEKRTVIRVDQHGNVQRA